MYDHFGWRLSGSHWEVGQGRLAETHEYFHRQLDDTTSFGGLTGTVAALADAQQAEGHWRDVRDRLLAMCDLVHETFAVGASLLTSQRSIEPIHGYPAYDRHVRTAQRLLGLHVHPWVALVALRAAAMTSMQSHALALAAGAGLTRLDPAQVPATERPNHRLAALLKGDFAATVQHEQRRAARAHDREAWWSPPDGVRLSPDAMDGQAGDASGELFRRLFDAASEVIERAGALPVVGLDGHHDDLRVLLAEARNLAPEGLGRIGALVEAPGGELLHGGPLDGQVIELAIAPRRAVVLPHGSASPFSGEGTHRHVFAVVTTPRRLRAAHSTEGIDLPHGEIVAAARTTVFDGDVLDSVLYLLVDGPEQLDDSDRTFVSVMSSAVAAAPEFVATWMRSVGPDRVSLVMDTPATAALRRWCSEGAVFRSETRLVASGGDEVRIIAGRVHLANRQSPLVIIPTTEFGARWFEAARAEDPLLHSVVVEDPELFKREAAHLDVVLAHLLVEERFIGTGSWRS